MKNKFRSDLSEYQIYVQALADKHVHSAHILVMPQEAQMKFLTNTHDPKDVEGAKMNLALSYEDWQDSNGRERAWQHHLDYLKGKIIGDPQATEAYTVEQLKEMGLVGVYAA